MSQVVVLKAEKYDLQLIKDNIGYIFKSLGGLDKIIPQNIKVLLKPNLLSARVPDECVDTHPIFVKAVIEVLKTRTSWIQIGDSPGGYVDYQEVLDKSGIGQVARETGIEVVKFEKSRIVDGLPIAEEVFDADIVISLPKFKTHCLTVITAGVKNCFGCVPGLFKTECHKSNPKGIEMAQVVLNVYDIVRPALTILDAIYSLEGEGPAAGHPRRTGLILAGFDAVSVDAVITHLIGLKPEQVPTTKLAHLKNIGESNLFNIEILGESNLDVVKINDFKLSKTALLEKLPSWLTKFLGAFIKFYPEVIPQGCIKCGICVKSCPVNAIDLIENTARINHKKCILCLCCHEMCPENTIKMKRNFLARIIQSIK
ncbi:MAG: DUF362 domain-containing protein [Candidatus Saelkia tenebricola]|nr:DUF362 domain-containing protein [Candidatus Saelkia tenebricola]